MEAVQKELHIWQVTLSLVSSSISCMNNREKLHRFYLFILFKPLKLPKIVRNTISSQPSFRTVNIYTYEKHFKEVAKFALSFALTTSKVVIALTVSRWVTFLLFCIPELANPNPTTENCCKAVLPRTAWRFWTTSTTTESTGMMWLATTRNPGFARKARPLLITFALRTLTSVYKYSKLS